MLLVDDTWTTGSNVQSAAYTLREAGAWNVSALVLARWLDPARGQTAELIKQHLQRPDYDPGICPWTASACPAA